MFGAVARPRRISPAVVAAAGGLLALLLGLEPVGAVGQVWRLTWDATAALIAIMLLSRVLDEVGVFRWAALHVARGFAHRPRLLLAGMTVLSGVLAGLFTNDAAVLIATPLVLELAEALSLPDGATWALAVGVGMAVDTGSLPFPVSNLVNILVADALRISFGTWARAMILPFLVSLALTAAGIVALHGRRMGVGGRSPDLAPQAAVRDAGLFRLAVAALGVLFLALFLGPRLGWPVSAPLLAMAATFLLLAHVRRVVPAGRVLREAPWDVVAFAVGMYLVVDAVQRSGGLVPLDRWMHTLAGGRGVLDLGLVSGVVSALVNNLPGTLLGILGIQGVPSLARRTLLAYAVTVGADIGPKLTPFGSLATLLWFELVRRRFPRPPVRSYLATAWVLTPPLLVLVLLAVRGG